MRYLAALVLVVVPSIADARMVRVPLPSLKVTKVAIGACSTDGGKVKCPTGLVYLGEIIQRSWNAELEAKPVACAYVTKKTETFELVYEYNDGTATIRDAEKSKAPPCVQDFSKQVATKYLEVFKKLRDIDPSIDVRTSYKITVSMK